MKLQAYHADIKIKQKYIARVKAYAKADKIIKGTYWANGKGCAVGCTIHSAHHAAYETELGIPVMLARLEDTIFEGASNNWSKTWPERFLKAIKPGADLSRVGWKFQHWLLLDPKDGAIHFSRPQDKELFEKVGSLLWDLALGKQIDQSAAESAAWSAESAGSAAESVWSAAESAAWSAAESAWSAAWSAAESAMSAARSAAWSAELAAGSAESAASAISAARSAAWSAELTARSAAAYERQGEKLLKLLKDAK